jgi:hypothetical protein
MVVAILAFVDAVAFLFLSQGPPEKKKKKNTHTHFFFLQCFSND